MIKKCRVSSPPPFTEEKVKEEKEKNTAPAPSPKKKPTSQSKSKSKPDPESDPEPDACLYCDLGDMKNEKLVSCKDCQTIGKDWDFHFHSFMFTDVFSASKLSQLSGGSHGSNLLPAMAMHQLQNLFPLSPSRR